jgi:hypothetical protein
MEREELLEWARRGLEVQLNAVCDEQESGRIREAVIAHGWPDGKPKRTMSAATRRAMSIAQRKRWKERQGR